MGILVRPCRRLAGPLALLASLSVAAPAAFAQTDAACLVGRVSGLDPADAASAAALLCEELRALGVAVGEPGDEGGTADSAYVIDLSRLGASVVVDLSYEEPVGSRIARERRQLAGIEEVVDVAAEMADALLEGPDGPEPAQPTAPVAVAGDNRPACLIGEHSGLDPADAETAAALVCDALRDEGVAVGSPTTSAGGASVAYRTTLRRLGRAVLVEVARESPPGDIQDSRRLQLTELEEVPVAAPRLADALVHNRPIAETTRVGTLVGEETRYYDTRPGDTFWAVGIAGVALTGTDVLAAPGFTLRFFYETLEYGIGTEMLITGGPGGDEANVFFSWGVGGRYFFSQSSGSLYTGGGFAWDTLGSDTTESEDGFTGTNTGVGFYAQIGYELFREHASRLLIELRVDLPVFELKRERTVNDVTQRDAAYVVPVSLAVIYAW